LKEKVLRRISSLEDQKAQLLKKIKVLIAEAKAKKRMVIIGQI